MQLDIGSALKTFLETQDVGREIHVAQDLDALPEEGDFLGILPDAPKWEEYIDNCDARVEFRIYTVVTEPDQREAKKLSHRKAIRAIQDVFSDQNFEAALAAINSQPNTIGSVQIGFSGWEAYDPEPEQHIGSQIITVLPYSFIAFIAAAES